MQISVKTDIEAALRKLETVTEQKQFRFAVARALTLTAVDVQKQVRLDLRKKFQIRRDWVVNNVRMEKATKENLTATVYHPADFMGRQEEGGTKTPFGNYIAVPTSLVRRTKKEVIRKSDRPKNLGDRAEVIDFEGNKWLALKRPRKTATGPKLRLLYLLVPRASIKAAFWLSEGGIRVARAQFRANLDRALREAVANAR